MIKLARYLKKYSAFLIAGVILLVMQAVMELSLPSIMSDIVNVGIQKGGIEEIAPKALSKEAFEFMAAFMDEEDLTVVNSAYVNFADLSLTEKENALKTYPEAENKEAFIFNSVSKENKGQLDEAFLHSISGVIELLGVIEEETGESFEFGESNEVGVDFDLGRLSQIDFSFMTPESFEVIKENTKNNQNPMASSVISYINKGFYKDLGRNTDKIQTNYIVKTGGIMLLISLLLAVCAIGASFGFARLGTGVAKDLRHDVFSKVMSYSAADLNEFSTSSLITRSTNDIMQVQLMYTMALRMMVFAPIMGIGGIIMARSTSSGMSWLIAVAVAVMITLIAVFYVIVMPKFKKMQKLIDRLNLVSRENLTGMMVIRAFGTEDFQEERFEEANSNYTKNSLFVGRAAALMMPVITLIMNILCLLIVWFGADQVSKMQMNVGDIMAYIQYAMHIVMSFMFIAMIFVLIPRAAVSAERINAILRKDNLVKDAKDTKTFKGTSAGGTNAKGTNAKGANAKGVVAFDNVSFKYPGADECVLENISFTAKPGETTAFIGSTGSGKSTLINLIPRFYDISDGKISIDGIDIRDIKQKELRENIAYVPQKGLLFSGDIAGNLRYGKPDADEAQLKEAVEIAQAADFISKKEDGLASEVSQGGSNFSGGQKQRLSIARAIVKKAPVCIFDDSFSALDFATDSKLRAALKPHTKNSTVLIVAQRVSTIMYAEQIIVLDKGNIVGKGTHEELIKTCETYREIAQSQLSPEEVSGHPLAKQGGMA